MVLAAGLAGCGASEPAHTDPFYLSPPRHQDAMPDAVPLRGGPGGRGGSGEQVPGEQMRGGNDSVLGMPAERTPMPQDRSPLSGSGSASFGVGGS